MVMYWSCCLVAEQYDIEVSFRRDMYFRLSNYEAMQPEPSVFLILIEELFEKAYGFARVFPSFEAIAFFIPGS
nr:hypothetical protein [Tanacetum cinerariifolium]